MKITDYQIVNHGIENEQYFQGCGVCFTKFEYVATGIGSSPCLALEDALEQAAQCGHDTENIVNDLSNETEELGDECYFYCSVRYNIIDETAEILNDCARIKENIMKLK